MRSNKVAPVRSVKGKTPQLSTKKSVVSKLRNKITVDEIDFFYSALNEVTAHNLANKLIDLVEEHEDIRSMATCYRKLGVLPERFHEALKVFPKLKTAHEYVKVLFSERKEKIAEERDPKFHSDSLHIYSYDHAADKTLDHERKKDLKKITEDSKNDNTTKVIVLSQLDTGELVQIGGKKEEDER